MMQEAHDLIELKHLIAQLGLKDERRQAPRYNVEIAGYYIAGPEQSAVPWEKCWLVDVSKEGLSVKINDSRVKSGTILHLEFPKGGGKVGIATRVVYVDHEGNDFIVGLTSTRERNDIIQQLFSS